MTTTQELGTARSHFRNERIPAWALNIMDETTEDLVASGAAECALKPGAAAPDFILPDVQGNPVRLYSLLKNGPVVLVFYRAGWCPYCDLHLRGFQRLLSEFRSLSAQIVAVSPQLPDHPLDPKAKNGLEPTVLSDVALHAARTFGIVFTLPRSLLKLYDAFGHSLANVSVERGQTELPLAATFVINSNKRIAFAHVDADCARRAEPLDILQHIRQHKTCHRMNRKEHS